MEEANALGKLISYLIYGFGALYLVLILCFLEEYKKIIFSERAKELYWSAFIGAVILYFLFCMTIQFPAWYLVCLFWFSKSEVS